MPKLFSDFNPISLKKTNELASMQSRIDNKYIVTLAEFEQFLELIRPQYSVLEIEEKRQFSYQSCYYDDNYGCYFEHHQGRRQRLKVRIREYVDGGGMKYFEVKLKGARGITVKHRCETDTLIAAKIDGTELAMLKDIYFRHYHKELLLDLTPSLIVDYRRTTLVALAGGERVTVDCSLGFDKTAGPGGEEPVRLGSDFIVIETKSRNGRGIADTTFKSLKIRRASGCSKYCIGVNLTGCVSKNNQFLPIIKRAARSIVNSCEAPPRKKTAHTLRVGLA